MRYLSFIDHFTCTSKVKETKNVPKTQYPVFLTATVKKPAPNSKSLPFA